MHELLYFLISFVEIILTAFIVFQLIKAKSSVIALDYLVQKKINFFISDFRKFKKNLSFVANFIRFHKKNELKIKSVKKIIELAMGFAKIFSLLRFMGYKY